MPLYSGVTRVGQNAEAPLEAADGRATRWSSRGDATGGDASRRRRGYRGKALLSGGPLL